MSDVEFSITGFGFAKHSLTATQKSTIRSIAERLVSGDDEVPRLSATKMIEIIGHAIGTRNLEMHANKRAESVLNQLKEDLTRLGASSAGIAKVKLGEPVTKHSSGTVRVGDRRVLIAVHRRAASPPRVIPVVPPVRPPRDRPRPEPRKKKPVFPAPESNLGTWFDDPQFLKKGIRFEADAVLDDAFHQRAARLIRAFEQCDKELYEEELRKARQRVLDLQTDRRRIKKVPRGAERQRRLAKLQTETERARKERRRVTRQRAYRGESVEWSVEVFATDHGVALSPPLPGPPGTFEGAAVVQVFADRDMAAVVGQPARQMADIHSHPARYGPIAERSSKPDRRGHSGRRARSSGYRSLLLTPSLKLREYNSRGRVGDLGPVADPEREQIRFAKRFLKGHRAAILEFQRRQARRARDAD